MFLFILDYIIEGVALVGLRFCVRRNWFYWFIESRKCFVSCTTQYNFPGDGTPMDMWDFRGWKMIPQNRGLQEPKYLTPHLIQHINPGVKLIVLLRNPADRFCLLCVLFYIIPRQYFIFSFISFSFFLKCLLSVIVKRSYRKH